MKNLRSYDSYYVWVLKCGKKNIMKLAEMLGLKESIVNFTRAKGGQLFEHGLKKIIVLYKSNEKIKSTSERSSVTQRKYGRCKWDKM